VDERSLAHTAHTVGRDAEHEGSEQQRSCFYCLGCSLARWITTVRK
jgi:hypothetical protein